MTEKTPETRSAPSAPGTCSILPASDEVEEMRARHVAWIGRPGYCECGEKMPCDAARLLALVDVTRGAVVPFIEEAALLRARPDAVLAECTAAGDHEVPFWSHVCMHCGAEFEEGRGELPRVRMPLGWPADDRVLARERLRVAVVPQVPPADSEPPTGLWWRLVLAVMQAPVKISRERNR